MTEPIPVTIPLINPNEPGALLVSLDIHSGQHVAKGDLICTLETTKSTQQLVAERDGYLVGLAFSQGQTVQAGDILGFLADSPNELPPAPPMREADLIGAPPGGLRISQAALKLAQQHSMDLTQFSGETFITEMMVQKVIQQSNQAIPDMLAQSYGPEAIIVYGGGGHGKALIDLIRSLSTFSIAGIVDDSLPQGETVMGETVLGGAPVLEQLAKRGCYRAANAVGGIGNITSRITVFKRLAMAGISCPTLVHPTAFVEPSATLADGVQVMPHAYVGSESRVGFGAIVNTGAIVSHDCTLGDYANLSPGAILAGEVSVGEAVLVGMGVTVNLRVKIGSRARIGNGATVKQDVPEGGIVRAGTIWRE